MVVLNCHRVSPHPNPFWSPLHPRLFEELLVFLKRHFQVTSFEQSRHADASKPVAILSFDDGYHDFMEYTMPLLRKHGVAANQNIIPACVESGEAPWTVQVSDFLNSVPRTLINEIRLDGFEQPLRHEDIDSKVRYGLALSRFLKMRSRQERQPLWDALTTVMERANGRVRKTRMMTLADVRAAANDHEIGVHSYSHESMGFESDEFFQADFSRCQAFFRERLRLPLTIYAFPNNSYRASQIAMLEQSGIPHILLVDERFALRGERIIPRVTMHGESSSEVRFRTLGYRARSLQ